MFIFVNPISIKGARLWPPHRLCLIKKTHVFTPLRDVHTLGCVTVFRLQGIKVYWKLQFLEYLRTSSLKFQKTQTKIEVFLTLPWRLSQFRWDSEQGRVRTTSILVQAFWNFKLKVLKYPRNCSLQYTFIPNFWHPLTYMADIWGISSDMSKHVRTREIYRQYYYSTQDFD